MMERNIIPAIVLGIILSLTACTHKQEAPMLEGRVKREVISLAPKLAGRILKIYVTEAAMVKPGDTLALLDIPEVEAKIQQAEGATAAASAQYEMALHGATREQLDQVNAMYNVAKEQFAFAQKSLKRVQNMFDDSLISPQSFDEAFSRYNAAKGQYEAAAAKKQELTGSVREEQLRMTSGQKQQAEGVLREANTAYHERYIIAPKAMSIETIALHEGELALPGYNIFIGYELDDTFFRFTAGESQMAAFKQNENYMVMFPFNKDQKIQARLVGITELGRYAYKTSAYPNYQMGEAVYELKFVPVNTSEAAALFINSSVFVSGMLAK